MEYRRSVFSHEIDMMQIVHHSNYLRWFEEARLALMEEKGYPYTRLTEQGLASPVTALQVRYLAPARYPDRVVVDIRLAGYNGVQLTFRYAVRREEDGALLCEAETTHCLVGANGVPVRIRRMPELDARLSAWAAEEA